MTHALTLSNQIQNKVPVHAHTYNHQISTEFQFINRSIFANSYHHEIGIPIHEIYTWNTYNPQIYTCSHIQASGLTGLISYDQINLYNYIQQWKYGSHTSILYLKCIQSLDLCMQTFRGIGPNMIHFIQLDPSLLVYITM